MNLPHDQSGHNDLRQTAGWQYAEDYLSSLGKSEREWIALNLNSGHLIHCPNCHFVRIARYPFAWDSVLIKRHGDPGPGACDVCYHIFEAATFGYMQNCMAEAIKSAPGRLEEARAARAQLLYDLWMSSTGGAEALVWAAMGEAVQKAEKEATESAGLTGGSA